MIRSLFNRQSARRWLNQLNKKRPKTYEEALSTLDEAKDIIRQQNAQILRLIYDAHSDKLTGLLNPRGLERLIEHLADTAGTTTNSGNIGDGVIIAIDMSRLKIINDEYGHSAGDKAIKTFAKTIRNNVRRSDFAVRMGGDEFIVMLTETTANAAATRIENLKSALSNVSFEHEGHTHTVSARFGVAEYNSKNPLKTAIEQADQRQIEARKAEPAHKKRTAPISTLTSTR